MIPLCFADVVYSNWTVDRVVDTFDRLQTEILVGAERFSVAKCKYSRPNVALAQDNAPDSGFIMGRVKHVIPLLEDERDLEEYWLATEGRQMALDVGRAVVTTMTDWAFWHSTDLVLGNHSRSKKGGAHCPVPWYYAHVCGSTSGWTMNSQTKQCVNTDLHRLCTNTKALCADAYDISGCRVAQRHVSRKPVTRAAKNRTREGDWAEDHGKGKSRRMLRTMLKRLVKSCRLPTSHHVVDLSHDGTGPPGNQSPAVFVRGPMY
eukprot:Polyplicarium_translucidae@DN1982_c0_g1_i2.p1